MARLITIHSSGFRIQKIPCYNKQLKLFSYSSTMIAYILQIEVISESPNVHLFP